MKIKQKMMIGFMAIGLVPVLVYGGYSIYNTYSTVKKDHDLMLSQMNNSRKHELETFYKSMGINTHIMAANKETIDAYKILSREFSQATTSDLEKKRLEVLEYYKTQFDPMFIKKTGSRYSDYSQLVKSFSPSAVSYQHSYIVKNKHQIGEKKNLFAKNDGSAYDQMHAEYQKEAKEFIDTNGYYDLFLVDMDGNIVYSYFKETDFATNLKTGHLKDSSMGKLFARAAESHEGKPIYSDIDSYFPSYQAPAAFVLYPVKDNAKIIGYTIVQIPVPLIDKVLNNNGLYEEAGYGETGETILLSLNDFKLRSNSRAISGDDKTINERIEAVLGLSDSNKKYIKNQNTAALTFKLDNNFTNALNTKPTVVGEFPDYMGDVSYGRGDVVTLGDQKYAIISRFEKDEVFEAFHTAVIVGACLIMACIVIIAFVAWRMASSITSPILKVSESLKGFSSGDLSARVNIAGTDEVAEMAVGFDKTMDQMVKIFNAEKVDWAEVAKQKEREAESQKQIAAALENARTEQKKAQDAMNHSEQLAAQEKKASDELQRKVDEILAVVRKAQNGDLTQNIQVSGSDAIGQLAGGLKIFFDQLSEDLVHIDRMSKSLQEQSQVLSEKNTQMNDNSQSTAKKVMAMKDKTTIVTTNIKNLNFSTQEMKQAVTEISKQAQESSRYSNDAVKFVSGVKDLGLRLEENTEDISRFLQTINTIARQTNLLALNATIEAARAGEAGRGFAVVANEVKELARQAGDAADEITQKVGTIKDNTGSIMESIFKVSDLIDSISNSSRIVASATEQQYATTEQFVTIIDRSVKEVEEIEGGANTIANATESSMKIVQDNLSVSRDLDKTSETFSRLLSKFKLRESGNHENLKSFRPAA